MPDEQVRCGGRYVADKPGAVAKRIEPLIDPKAAKPGDPSNHNKDHHDYPTPPAPKEPALKKEGA